MGNEPLTDYVLVSQDKVFVEHFTKQAGGDWLYRSYGETDDVLKIETIKCDLNLGEIYDRIEFDLNDNEHLPTDN
jgi:hypothetical protein